MTSTKKLSLPTATALVVANMVGTGIFTTLGFQVVTLHSAFTILLLWLIGGLLSLCGAMVYGCLSANFPRSGGEYHLLSKMMHPAIGCMAGFISATVGFAAPTALAAMAFGKYFQGAFPAIPHALLTNGLILIVTAILFTGTRGSAIFQNGFTLLKIILLLTLTVACWLWSDGAGQSAYASFPQTSEIFSGSFAIGLVYVMFAYSGWNAAIYLASDVKNAQRNVPRALLLGTLIVTGLYLAVNAAFLYAAPRTLLEGQVEVGLIVGNQTFGETGGKIVSLLIAMGLVSAVSAMLWLGPQVAMAMGEDLPGLRWMSKKNRQGVPWSAMLIQLGLILVLLSSSGFEKVLLWAQATLLWCSFFTVGGIFISRVPLKGVTRKLKFFAGVFLVITAWMIFHLFTMKPTESFLGLLFLLFGWGIYFLGKRKSASCAVLGFLALGSFSFAHAQNANQSARLLAGLPVTDPAYAHLVGSHAWQEHAQALDTLWGQRTGPQLERVRRWASSELHFANQSTLPAFYFFSGPDFLYLNAIYSSARNYILSGKEPIGTVPDLTRLTREQWTAALPNLQTSLKTILNFSFFITEDMKTDLRSTELTGVLPILYVFLARTGKEIQNVASVQSNGLKGVRIDFIGQVGLQSLYYFETDLSNTGIRANGSFLAFCKNLGTGNALLKSASYLPHIEEFSKSREFLLAQCQVIVQDDAGIPLRFFNPQQWNVRVFGSYPGPIDIFKKYTQPDLAQRYAVSNPKPLDFGMGYRFRPDESTIIVAFKKANENSLPNP